jgi:hypothetical protein
MASLNSYSSDCWNITYCYVRRDTEFVRYVWSVLPYLYLAPYFRFLSRHPVGVPDLNPKTVSAIGPRQPNTWSVPSRRLPHASLGQLFSVPLVSWKKSTAVSSMTAGFGLSSFRLGQEKGKNVRFALCRAFCGVMQFGYN